MRAQPSAARSSHRTPSSILGARGPVVALLAVLLAVLPVLAVGPRPAGALAQTATAAPAQNRSATIALADPTPRVLRQGSSLVLRGTVRNTGTTTIARPVVHLGIVDGPLDTRDQVDRWARSSEGFDEPTRVGTGTVTELAPGAQAPFTITVPADRLRYRYYIASLPATLTVTEGTTLTAAATRGVARTYLEWTAATIPQPVRTGWIVPLTLPADPDLFGPTGDTRTAAWNRAIGPGSAVARTLDALQGQPVTWLVDPTMLEPPGAVDPAVPAPESTPSTTTTTTPSSTSTTSSPTPTPTPSATASSSTGSSSRPASTPSATPGAGTPTGTAPSESAPTSSSTTSSSSSQSPQPSTPATVESLAADLRTRLQQVRAGQPVWFLPYGDPDLTALASAGGAEAVREHLDRPLSADLRQIGTTMPMWAASEVTPSSLAGLSRTWRQTTGSLPVTFLSTRELTGDQHRPTTSAGRRLVNGAPVLVYDEPLSFFAGAGGGDPGLRTQRFLAETLAIYQQQPQAQRSLLMLAPRTGQASPAQLARVITAARSVPWLRPITSTALVQQARTAQPSARLARRTTPFPATPPASPVDPAALTLVGRNREIAGALDTILVDSADVIAGWDRSLSEMGSTRWRGRGAAYGTTLRTTSDALDSLTTQVAVRPSTVNFFANSGMLSITVVNNLARPVRDVQLVVTPRKGLLWVKRQPAPLSLPAGGRTTVRVPVQAVAAGTAPVDVALSTPGGEPLGLVRGEPVKLKVNVRPTATWIYWVLGIVAGLIFVVGLFRSVRKGPRAETAMPLPDDVPEPIEGDDD
ncbi:DUF6049 family protein [Luteipulveratus flavus]|uniref:DUF6049 family protein n=1 Tax=Luteipulveratus flavus TaxID=3031728 RepID=A0ABT6C4I6_9MICO|nr:DUF6049 family protein [Luteipulveratus sp. YIM 133296]MDF8263866.1 DUF6049 family protein [Luteipulveratus sp. YIM 133296]